MLSWANITTKAANPRAAATKPEVINMALAANGSMSIDQVLKSLVRTKTIPDTAPAMPAMLATDPPTTVVTGSQLGTMKSPVSTTTMPTKKTTRDNMKILSHTASPPQQTRKAGGCAC